ncbi:ROK family protein [Nonomuraea diastatica]|uniref:ROK family protein n=1 Tax=Nonomuraea diastatica TaxID=1848329 RepID=A0A4R4WJA8_9ACTN|nr:ROK family protein [Nonomuraea diastatica]TDD19169.1 ROK family protein [Nonomuraea diastatica]
MTSHVIAVDVGGTAMKGALVTRDGDVEAFEKRPTRRERGPEHVLNRLGDFAADLAAQAPVPPLATGVAVPGLVDEKAGVASRAANLGWRDAPISAMLGERLGIPVALGHDVRAGGLAENVYGAGAHARNFLFLAIGTGIAGAMILEGRPYGGACGHAGEAGHIPVRPDGEPCVCGRRGCLETYASAASIVRRYGKGRLRTEDVLARANQGDDHAKRVVNEAIEALATGLATCTLLLDPELIVIGGGLAGAGERLLDPLAKELAARLSLREPPPISRGALGIRASMLGAGILAWSVVE